MNLQDLPDQLICIVASHLGAGVGTANWRLANKHFARVVEEAHFETFKFEPSTSRATLKRFTEVLMHMARHVKKLKYNGAKDATEDMFSHHDPPCQLLCLAAQGFQMVGARLTVVHADMMRFDFFALESHVDKFAEACASVRELCLDVSGPTQVQSVRPEARRTERIFKAFLIRLKELEVLSLIFDKPNSPFDSHLLRDLVSVTHTWPRLRDLRVHSIYFVAPDLVDILRNHASTLVSLQLTGMHIEDSIALGGEMPTAADLTDEGWAAKMQKKRDEVRELIAQIGTMRLRHVLVSEHRAYTHIEYGEEDENMVEWVINGDHVEPVIIRTNPVRYLVDEESEVSSSYWSEGGGEWG